MQRPKLITITVHIDQFFIPPQTNFKTHCLTKIIFTLIIVTLIIVTLVAKYQISISSSGCGGRCRQSGLRQRQLKPAAAYSFIQLIHSYTLCWPAVTALSPPSKTRVCTLQLLCCSPRRQADTMCTTTLPRPRRLFRGPIESHYYPKCACILDNGRTFTK